MTLLKFYRWDFVQWNTINKMKVKSGYSYASTIKEVNNSSASPMNENEKSKEFVSIRGKKIRPWSRKNVCTVVNSVHLDNNVFATYFQRAELCTEMIV